MRIEDLRISVSLRPDQLYWDLALTQFASAVSAAETAGELRRSLHRHPWYRVYLMDDLGEEVDFSVAVDEHNILPPHLEITHQAEAEIRNGYRVLHQALAATHVFCAATLEAHINSQARVRLSGRAIFDEFDRLSLRGKWLMLPKLLGKEGFDPGAHPYNKFVRLTGIRTALVHVKGNEISTWTDAGPTFPERMGLRLEEAEASIQTTERMIRSLAAMLSGTPDEDCRWLLGSV